MLTPRPYQVVGINLAAERNVMICDEPGLGKSLQAIEAVKKARQSNPIYYRPVLIIAPSSTTMQWVEAIVDQEPGGMVYMLGTAGAGLPDRDTLQDGDWVVCHYEAVLYQLKAISKIRWGTIICDEAHRIKNRSAKRSMAIKLLHTARKIALTGTPMEKTPADLWSVLNWLYPERYHAYWAFHTNYVEVKENWMGYKQDVGAKNPERLADEIGNFYLQRTKAEVAPDLPPLIMQQVTITLGTSQKKLYNQIATAKDIEVEVDDGRPDDLPVLLIKNTLSKIVRLQQICSWPPLLDLRAPSAKIDWIVDYLSDNPEEPVVVFTKFRDVAIHLSGLLKADIIVGGMNSYGIEFQSGRKRVLVGTISAMGEGLNLQRAKTAIFMEQEWSTIKMQQAVDRIHRMNNTEPKNVIKLRAEGSVDNLVQEALTRKWTEQELVYHYLKGGSNVAI